MEKPKVSVIIPVYNTEIYVEEAVRSIMNQTLRDIQIIIIDDGSSDKSLSVIKKLADEDERIYYLSQTNQGQSVARNKGMEIANAEYVYFMDSDDLLAKDAFEICYNKCISENLDFVFFDAENFGEVHKTIDGYNRKGQLDMKVHSGIEILNRLLDIWGYRVSPWLFFINLQFLRKETITFDENLKIYEDQPFSARLYLSAKRVAYIPLSLFHRRLRNNSLMTSNFTLSNVKAYFYVADQLLNEAKEKTIEEKSSIERIIKEMLNAVVYLSNQLTLKERLTIGVKVWKDYCCYISIKTWIVLFFPWTIKIKSFIRMKF